MEDLIKQYLMSLLRNLAGPVIAYLIGQGIFTANQAEQLLGLIIVAVGAAVWGLANKYVFKQKIVTALKLPAGSSEETLRSVMK